MEIFFEYAGLGFKGVVAGIAEVVSYIKILGYSLGAINTLFKDFESGKGFNATDRWKNLVNDANIELGKTQEFVNKIFNPQAYETKDSEPQKFVGRKVTPYIDKEEANKAKKILEGLAMAKQLSIEYERQLNFSLDVLKAKGEMNYMTQKEKSIAEAVAKVTDDTSKKLTEIQNKKEEALAHGVDQKVLDEMDKQKEKVIELGKVYENLTRIEITQQEEAQRTFEYGWNKAFRQSAEDAQNFATMGTQAFDTMSSGISSAIDRFVDSGKTSFADFTTSIIKDLIKIQLKMQAMALFRMAAGFLGFGGGPAAPISDQSAPFSVDAKAEGGDLSMGVPTLVGERGPELIIPQRAGTVIPNNKLSDMMGSGQTTNYNGPYISNMSAIDTQSAVQFLASNKMAVWSANQSASRSIPASR
jgi:lambda family phage tail tape measure protein